MPRRSAAAAARDGVRHPDDTRRREDKTAPKHERPLFRWIKLGAFKIKRLIEAFQNSQGRPLSRSGQEYLNFVRREFFPYMRFDMRMTPKLRNSLMLDIKLQEVIDNDCGLPDDVVATAELLYEKFESEGWGDPTARPRTTEGGPPADHPIWGIDGIMHGAIMVTGGKKLDYKLDHRYRNEQRDFRAYGDNGLTPGDWFPRAVIAEFKGAHAGKVRGICGDADQGAYAISVSGKYEEDRDQGEVLYYSGEGADKSTNPNEFPSRPTNDSLVASLQTQRPVRVLRSSPKDKHQHYYAPPCGIRYDGLYEVVGVQERLNAQGGLYQRFKLRRLPGQEDLDDIIERSPTPAQRRDFEKVKDGY